MLGKPDKRHRIRVRALDGKPREPNKLKGQLVPHVDVLDAKDKVEFIICAVKEAHLEQVRAKLGAAGLEELMGGDTNVSAPASPKAAHAQPARHGGPQNRGRPQQPGDFPQRGGPPQGRTQQSSSNAPDLRKKPYGFVALPKELTTAAPVWHDGTSAEGRLSGEIRCELETLTPLLVGWERRQAGDNDEPWPVTDIDGIGTIGNGKSVLCPLRAPWGKQPVVIPGDSLKGLFRHESGALLGAPMERVAERSYSYRPNSMFAKGAQLIPRIARVSTNGVTMKPLSETGGPSVRVPTQLDLLPENLEFDSPRLRNHPTSRFYRFDDGNGAPYRGGQGAGEKLNSKRNLHQKLAANPTTPAESMSVPASAQDGYLATLRHLLDERFGHFSERHPDHSEWGAKARARILKAAASEVFQPGDLIWVEWDTEKKRVVSLGWHYYYRWAYADTVRRRGGGYERHGLFPLQAEREHDDDGAPRGLSPVRRLFGYTGDNNEGSKGIGKDDHSQLMGRVSVNAGFEVIDDADTDEKRFLPPTFLRELGMPRPSAVEHYLRQPHHPKARPSDRATLVTYGDAKDYDEPGDLAGRKFYLDRKDTYIGEPWKDDSAANRANDRSTLALEASRPGRRFRFTVRFRDLDPAELAALVVAVCPHQFRAVLGGDHTDGYCSKLGYARPLGWGTVRIEAKALLLLDVANGEPALNAVPDVLGWVRANHQPTPAQAEWLAVHRHKHPDATDYPRKDGQIYTFHTTLRAEHSRARRYRPERSR